MKLPINSPWFKYLLMNSLDIEKLTELSSTVIKVFLITSANFTTFLRAFAPLDVFSYLKEMPQK